jgi:hypothetical protein
MSYRFYGFNIEDVTLENYAEILPKSLAYQIEIFLPPEGSFATPDLQRYLQILKNYEEEDEGSSMTLANRLRVAFRDLKPDTICGKFPQAELPLKRRLRCVAEYLIRSNEFRKLRDENGKLIKRKGVLGKMVVIYQPEAKLIESLRRQDLLQ